MKVLILNGSPHANGNTAAALAEMAKEFEKNGIETETVCVGSKPVQGCIACYGCGKTGKCVFGGDAAVVNEIAEKLEASDGLVVGSPVYFASANSSLTSLLDRIFYSSRFDKTMKVGAAVAVARRGGTTAAFDQLNKYFTISGMPVASGQYWNNVHGNLPGDAEKDAEGMQIMRTLAANMSFLIKSIALGKEKYGLPEKETRVSTNYIR